MKNILFATALLTRAAILSSVVAGIAAAGQLHQAVRARDMVTLDEILRRADRTLVNDRIEGGITPLHLAAATDQPEAIRMLLARGADIDARNAGDFTPLHWAASRDAAAAAAVLLDAGAAVDARARAGLTPLHWAAAKSMTNIVALLVERGADIRAVSDLGFTPVHLAVKANPHGRTAVMLAEAQVNAEIAAGIPVVERELPNPAVMTTNVPDPALTEFTDTVPEDLPPPEKGAFLNVPIGLGETLTFAWVESLKLWVGKFEVTNLQYRRHAPSHHSRDHEGLSMNAPDQPVVYVSWNDADAYCAWLSAQFANRIPSDMVFRLPTDREWTVIASCGGVRRYPWGDEWPPRYGNFSDTTARAELSQWRGIVGYNDGYPVSCPVQNSGMNEWGIYGLGGNVWEWTADWYDAEKQYRTRRGGSWDFDDRDSLEIAARGFDRPDARYDTIGFRVVVAAPLK